jgi:hypothetical protein
MPRACNKLGLESYVQLIAEEYVLLESIISNPFTDMIVLAVRESLLLRVLLQVALHSPLLVLVCTLSHI